MPWAITAVGRERAFDGAGTCRDAYQKNKGPAPFGVEPFTSDSVMVALHAHGGGAPAQGFHEGFLKRPHSTSVLQSGQLGANPSRCEEKAPLTARIHTEGLSKE